MGQVLSPPRWNRVKIGQARVDLVVISEGVLNNQCTCTHLGPSKNRNNRNLQQKPDQNNNIGPEFESSK